MRLFGFLILVSLGLFACQSTSTERKPASPNVLFILSDDQGYGDLRIHGNDSIDTPILDQLASEGTRLDQFYVSPVCAPTRAALMTGRHHLRTGTFWVTRGAENMRTEELTLAEALQANGYRTGCFGKWHNGAHYPYNPLGQGFERFVGFTSGHWSNYFNTTLISDTSTLKTEGYITDVLTDQAIGFIEEHQQEPFFCYIPYNVPHSPFQVPDRYFDKYKARGLTNKNASVYGMVENMDENIGRLLSKLDELGLSDNTIVVFITDNGPNGSRYNGNMRGWKGKVYEGGVRVPCIIRWPGKVRGQTLRHLTDHTDILPTLLGLTGIEKPEGLPLDGLDLSNWLKGSPKTFPERTLYSHQNQGDSPLTYPGAIRTVQYHFIMRGEDRVELYDMIQDRSETTDISAANPEVIARFKQQYLDWYAEVTADGPTDPAIPIGYREAGKVELPAHEAILSEQLEYKRNPNGWAHDWIVSWDDTDANASWQVDAVEDGSYAFSLLYTCSAERLGSKLALQVGEQSLQEEITEAFTPTISPNYDRVKGVRAEALEQTWAEMPLGRLDLSAGKHAVVLKAASIAGDEVGEIKGLIVRRID
ncbi:MAG: arylsulfatase [Bacteroidota bacterium]